MPFTRWLPEIREALAASGAPVDKNRFCLFLSGGADSTALLHVMAALAGKPGNLSAIAIDYGLRGADSEGDAEAAKSMCVAMGIPCRVVKAPPPPPGNIQHWARLFRRRLMAQVLREQAADFIATGHQADDRLEGFLLKLFQGQTPTLLPHRRGRLIRPLLSVGREEIRTALRGAGIPWREDRSNGETHYLRNRIRLGLLARLDGEHPAWRGTWAQAFEAALGRDEMIRSLARRSPYLRAAPGRLKVRPAFHQLPPKAAQALLAEALRRAFPGRRFTAFDFTRIFAAAKSGKTEGLFPYKGALVEIEKGRVASVENHRLDLPLAPDMPASTPWGTRVTLAPNPSHPPAPDGAHALPLPGYDGGMLRLVSAAPGARFTPKGQGGPVRLLRWLMNHGIPRWQRRRALCVMEGDRVLAVLTGRRPFPAAAEGAATWRVTWGRP